MGIHIGVVVDMLQEDSLPLAVVDTVAAGVDNLLVEGTGVDSLNQQYNNNYIRFSTHESGNTSLVMVLSCSWWDLCILKINVYV